MRLGVSAALPDFPWDVLAPYKARARSYSDGLVDLSIGTPVDEVPASVRAALASASDIPGYPATAGTARLRTAITDWLTRRCGATGVGVDGVLPTIGSKEIVAWLPRLLGLGPGDLVVIPTLAYPTYEVGARLAGAEVARADDPADLGARRPSLVWVNSPANPHGAVLGERRLRALVEWARAHDTLLVSDECYIELGWDEQPLSVLHPRVCDGSHRNLLAVHSLSKRSNMAGYRAGFVAGDPRVVAELLAVRKHAGMIVPAPVQEAMAAALDDDAHVKEQRDRYAARRMALRAGLLAAGFRVEGSAAGLYLWATRDEPCMDTVSWLADRGILASPGVFYGPAGERHVRVALTATDADVAVAVARLTA